MDWSDPGLNSSLEKESWVVAWVSQQNLILGEKIQNLDCLVLLGPSVLYNKKSFINSQNANLFFLKQVNL